MKDVEHMAHAKPTYAFLGPIGTFSDMAVRALVERGSLAGDYADLPCDSLDDVFEAVERGKADFGVVPIENSLEGSVTAVLDALAFTSRVEILGEIAIDVHQALLLHPDATIDDVTTVASHTQGIGQCRRWINQKLPGRTLRLADSTAAAAEMAAADKSVAAIASTLAAEIFGTRVYEEAIEDNLSSKTRFVIIGKGPVAHDGPGKSTLALFMNADRPGTLQMILTELIYAGVNLTMVQSRPMKQDLGDYMFFMDIDGYADDPNIQVALNCLRMKMREVKVIGSYPRSV